MALTARALAARGHAVTVAVFYRKGPMAAGLPEAGVTIVDLAKRGRYDIVKFMRRFFRMLHEASPEILYSHLPVQNIIALTARRVASRPVIVWGIRESGMQLEHYEWMTRLTWRMEGWAARYGDWVIANSQAGAAAAIARGIPSDRVSVIPNGIDLERFKPDLEARSKVRDSWGAKPETLVIGHVARVDPVKDHETFLRAVAQLAHHRPDIRAICIAAGPRSATEGLRATAHALNLADHLEIFDGCDTVSDVMNGFDVFCLSSAFGEGFPNVVAEAMACGVPCVVTRVGDAAALVGDAGMAVPTRNPEALARALLEVGNRRKQGSLAVPAIRARAAMFSPDRLAASLEERFEKLLGSA